MKINQLSSRAKTAGCNIHLANNPGAHLIPGWVMASRELIRRVVRDGSIKKIRGAGKLTINELRQYAGLKPMAIKRCKYCGQIIKNRK